MCIEYHSLIFLLFFRTENTDACLNNAKTKLKGLLWSETCSWISAEHAPSVKVAVSKQVKLHFWKQNGDASLEQPECMKWGVQDWISYPLMYERFKESQWFFFYLFGLCFYPSSFFCGWSPRQGCLGKWAQPLSVLFCAGRSVQCEQHASSTLLCWPGTLHVPSGGSCSLPTFWFSLILIFILTSSSFIKK